MNANSEDEHRAARYQSVIEGLKGSAADRRRAVEQLYDEFAGRLRRFLRRGATPAQADDLFHETWERVLRKGHTFQGVPQQLPGWLWRIARNLRSDALRAAGAREFIGIDDEGTPQLEDEHTGADPEHRAQISSLVECVKRHSAEFANAHPDRAQILSWLTSDQLKISEIAEILDRSEGATREYISQCRKKLRIFLEPCRRFVTS